MNNISASKVISPIYDIIDIKLLSTFYPKRNAEYTFKICSVKLGSNIVSISMKLEHFKMFSPIVEITNIKVIFKFCSKKNYQKAPGSLSTYLPKKTQ